MTKRFILFFFLIIGCILLLNSCTHRDHTTPIEGEWFERHYTNQRALFDVEVPIGLQLSAPQCIDAETKSLKIHTYKWEIRSKRGIEGCLYYYEPISDKDCFSYQDIYNDLKSNKNVKHIEKESSLHWLRMKIITDYQYDHHTYAREIIYTRHDSELKVVYSTNSEFHNEQMEQFVNGMEVRAIYGNLMVGNAGDLITIWFGLIGLINFGLIFLFIEHPNTVINSLITVALIIISCWVAWKMTGVWCKATYLCLFTTAFGVSVPFLFLWKPTSRFMEIFGKIGEYVS